MDREKWKKIIERELIGVNREISDLKQEPTPEELESFGDNTPLSEDVDTTVAVESREFKTRILDRLVDRAAALEDALGRIDEGTYGVCIVCGEEISEKRLRAVPEALRCARDQEELERELEKEEARDLRRFEDDYEERRKLDRNR